MPTPPPVVRLEAVDFTAYRLQSEWTFIQGFIHNTGSVAGGNIDVVVMLLADGDTMIGTAHAHIPPGIMPVGGRSPWLAQVRGAPVFQRVRVQAHAVPLNDVLQATVTQEFRLQGVTVRAPATPFSPPTIVGEVVNVGVMPVTEVTVTAAVFDGEGALHQIAGTVVKVPQLAPGEAAPYEIKPLGRGLTEIPRYELFVEGRPRPELAI